MPFEFDVLSIVFAFITILYLIMGLRKGFLNMLLYAVMPIFLLVAALVIGQFASKLVVELTPLKSLLVEPFENTIMGLSPYFAEENPGREVLTSVLSSNNYDAIVGSGIPAFVAPILTALILAAVPEAASTTKIGAYVADGAASAVIFILCVIIVYIILSLILRIFKTMLVKREKKIKEEKKKVKINFFSRIIGMGFGLFVSIVTICVISYVLELLFLPDPQLHAFLNAILGLDDPNKITIGKLIMQNNPLISILLKIFQTLKF